MEDKIKYELLGNICEFINGDRGKNYPSSKEFVDSGIPFINAGNIIDKKIDYNDMNYITKEKFKLLGSGKVEKGDILFCLRGSLGKHAIVQSDVGAIASSLVIIRPNNLIINNRYLMHTLDSREIHRQIERDNNGSSQPNLSATSVKKFKIYLPSIDEQLKITNILDKAQELIDKRKAQIEALDELVKSRFIEMFGDPINNNMKWEVKKLKEISTKILSGNTPKGGSNVYVDEGIMFFRSQNVWKNKLVLEDIAYIDEETHKKMLKSSLKYGDILLTKTGRINTENSSLGRAAMYLGKDDCANINGHVYLIRLKEEIINEFVLYILTSKEYRGYIRSVCVGGIDKRQLNKEHIEDFPIIFPPIEEQKRFVSYVKQVDKLKSQMQDSLKELEDNFNSLMQKAFKGELFN